MQSTGYLNNDFQLCLSNLMEHGLVAYPRDSETREILNYNITLLDPRNRVLSFLDRNVNTKYLIGELLWYLSGSPNVDGILPYSKFWDNIKNSGNELYYDQNTINSNYGNRLFGHSKLPSLFKLDSSTGNVKENKNQWKETIELLSNKDKDSRQAIINIHLPSDRHDGNKDVPCTLSLQFFIREDKLHLIVNMRSNDIILGFTNDVFQFTMLQEIMLLELKKTYENLELGYYYHNAGSMHVYSRHFDMANKIINDKTTLNDCVMIPMDKFDDTILSHLLCVEQELREANFDKDFNFDFFEFNELTPYWQTVIKALFMKDEQAMETLFGF